MFARLGIEFVQGISTDWMLLKSVWPQQPAARPTSFSRASMTNLSKHHEEDAKHASVTGMAETRRQDDEMLSFAEHCEARLNHLEGLATVPTTAET